MAKQIQKYPYLCHLPHFHFLKSSGKTGPFATFKSPQILNRYWVNSKMLRGEYSLEKIFAKDVYAKGLAPLWEERPSFHSKKTSDAVQKWRRSEKTKHQRRHVEKTVICKDAPCPMSSGKKKGSLKRGTAALSCPHRRHHWREMLTRMWSNRNAFPLLPGV